MLALGAVTIWVAVAMLIRLTGGQLGRHRTTVRNFRPPEAAPPLAFPAAARQTIHT
jgi:hypothetical protein